MANFRMLEEPPAGREVWYRVTDFRYAPAADEWGERPRGDGETGLEVNEYPVIRETQHGVWLEGAGSYGRERFVLRDARKRFACPTRAEAIESFVARKTQQRRILSSQLRHIERALALAAQKQDSGEQGSFIPDSQGS